MDGVYCIYVQKPESEIDLISYLDRVIRQNFFFFFFKTTAIRTVKPGLQICSKKVSKEISVCPTSCTLIFFYTASLLVSAKSSKQSTSFLTTRSQTHQLISLQHISLFSQSSSLPPSLCSLFCAADDLTIPDYFQWLSLLLSWPRSSLLTKSSTSGSSSGCFLPKHVEQISS